MLPVTFAAAVPFGRAIDGTFFEGEGERCGSGMRSLSNSGFDALGSLVEVRGVNPKPPKEVRLAGFALELTGFTAVDARPAALANKPSLVPGLLLRSLPFLLILDAGRGGGPIGLSTGEKKLDLRLALGVVGTFWRLSIVRSLKDGLEGFR